MEVFNNFLGVLTDKVKIRDEIFDAVDSFKLLIEMPEDQTLVISHLVMANPFKI